MPLVYWQARGSTAMYDAAIGAVTGGFKNVLEGQIAADQGDGE